MATLDIKVAAPTDDATMTVFGGGFSTTAIALLMGYQVEFEREVGMRFLNATIPVGATITNATLTFTAKNTKDTGSVAWTIAGEANSNGATFSTFANFEGRTRTTATVSWQPGAWTAESAYTTGDLKSIIQEIIGLDGWASGNAIVLFCPENHSTSTCRDNNAYSYDGSTTKSAVLHIEYTEGGGGASAVPVIMNSYRQRRA